MNWLDAAIIVVVLWLTYSAFQAGFIRETITIVAAVMGVVLAGLLYKDLADEVLLFIDNEALGRIVGFGIILGATVLAGQMLSMVLKPAVTLMQLGMFDQFGGAIFGFVKALVFVQIFVLVFVAYPRWGLDDAIDDSRFGSAIVENFAILENVLPEEFELSVDDFLNRL